MAKIVVVCGKLFDGLSDTIRGPSAILIEDEGHRGGVSVGRRAVRRSSN